MTFVNAVIPTHHAYFTEWMAQYKKLLKVIPQISIRFPRTDYNKAIYTRKNKTRTVPFIRACLT